MSSQLRTLVLPLVLVLGLLAAACSSDLRIDREAAPGTGGGEVPTPTPDGAEPTPVVVETPTGVGSGAQWTVMVYVMGDNDLEPFVIQDVLEMAAVGSTDEVNIVALVDRSPHYTDEPLLNLGNFESTKFIHVLEGELVDLTGDGVELNLGSAATLEGFITEAIRGFPAERYALVVWDHGAGWPGIGPDETDGFDVLDLADMDAGMSAGLAAAGVDRFDLLGFDACLMATYEVASVLAPYADYLLASVDLEPGHGWNYEALQALVDDPTMGPVELAGAIKQGFREQAVASGTDADITLSLVDMSALAALQDEIGALGQLFRSDFATYGPVLGQLRRSALVYADSPDPMVSTHLIDLGLFLDGLGPEGASARAALDVAVVDQINGPARASTSGLGVYFPPTADVFRQGYLFLEGVPHWPELLEAYYQAGQSIPLNQQPVFENVGNEADYFFDEDGLNIFGFFNLSAENNLVGADIYYGVLDETDGSIIFLGREDGEVSTDGSGLAAAIFNLAVLEMGDGVDLAYAYVDLSIDLDTGFATANIPLAYAAPGVFDESQYADVVLSLVANVFTEVIVQYTFYEVDSLGNWGELIVDPNGLIYPIVLNVYPDGSSEWIPTIDVGLYSDYDLLTFEFVPLPSGTPLYAELVVYDFGGNSDYVAMLDLVP